MNKKFLSAILFGVLMVTSTGTFVSCSDDYDDDIARIDSELSDLSSKLDALQTQFNAGKYVTSVTNTSEGLTITLSDGTSYNVTNGKDGATGAAGADGKDGDKVSVNEEGYWVINDEVTEYLAVTKDQLGQAVTIKTPEMSEDGFWIFYDEKGEVHKTTWKVAPVTAVQNTEDKTWTLTVFDTAGKSQTIKLPTAASMISEVEILGYIYKSVYDYTADGYWYPIADGNSSWKTIAYNFTIVDDAIMNKDATKEWNKEEGAKTLVKGQALSTIASSFSNLLVRIAPATLDASELSFSLVNSQKKEAPIELGTPVAYEGLLTRASEGNGLWQIPVNTIEGKTYKDADAYKAEFAVTGTNSGWTAPIAFALKEEGGFMTNYDLAFEYDSSLSLTTYVSPSFYTVDTNKEVEITFDDTQKVYDAHLHFEDADILRWGIVYNGGLSFTVTKLADKVTVPTVSATVHYVTLDGEVHKETVTIKPNKVNANTTELSNSSISVVADNSKNNFSISMSPMFSNLGSDETTLWRADVYRYDATLYRVKHGNELYDQQISSASTSGASALSLGDVTVSYDKDALKDVNSIKVAMNSATIGLDRFEGYYVLVNFYDNRGETLSTLKVPFNITIPTLSELLVKEKVVFNGTNDGTGVLNESDLNTNGDAIYSLKYAFSNQLKDAYAGNTAISFIVDPDQTIKVKGNDVKMNTLVAINNDNSTNVQVQLLDKTNAYNKAINMLVSSASYLNYYEYTDEELATAAFTLKIVSPIEQGTLEAAAGANAVINVVATEDGTAQISESDLIAKTYAGVTYKVFKDKFAGTATTATGWTSPYIKQDPAFKSTNENVFTMGNVQPATKDSKGTVTPGYVVVKPMNVAYEDAVPVEITLTDAWGYVKKVTINVKVSPNK